MYSEFKLKIMIINTCNYLHVVLIFNLLTRLKATIKEYICIIVKIERTQKIKSVKNVITII